MGCCTSSNTVAHSKSPTHAPIPHHNSVTQNQAPNPQNNVERVDAVQLQQHHDINQGAIEGEKAMQKIENEVMRLQEFELDNDDTHQHIEIKSNEISEDFNIISNDQNESFAEFSSHTVNINNKSPSFNKNDPYYTEQDTYHPFGIVQANDTKTSHNINETNTNNDSKELNQEEIIENLESLYADTLKEHGFDAQSFRTVNRSIAQLSVHQNDNTNNKSQSADISSFASSQLSSKSIEQSNNFQPPHDDDIMDQDKIDDDDEDLMMEELSRPNSFYQPDDLHAIDPYNGYIQNMKESVKDMHEISNIMDDEDEELMDAILSLDLEN